MSRLSLLSCLLFLTACPGESGPMFLGTPGEPQAARLDSNLFFMPTRIDGRDTPHLLVDTGAPTVVMDPTLAELERGYQTAASFEMLGLEYQEFAFVADSLLASDMGDYVAGGVIGCTAFCTFDVSFDYRAETVTLDGVGRIDDASETHVIDVALEGGGLTRDPTTEEVFEVPTSRVMVSAMVEGRPLSLLVDSGASVTVLRASLVEELLADGRPTLEATAMGMFGMDQSVLFRLRSMSVGGADVPDVIAARSDGFERLLDGIAEETGMAVDGALGGTALREFFVTVDYDAEQLRLDRYPNRDHVRDEATRIGILVAQPEATNVPVGEVIAGTDAEAQGVQVGDRIVAIDGVSVAGLSLSEIAYLLAGTRGAVRSVQFGCDGCGGFTGTRAIDVDYDALQLP